MQLQRNVAAHDERGARGSITLWERYLRTAGLESAVNLLTQFADAIERQDGDAAYALLEQGLDRQLAYYQA